MFLYCILQESQQTSTQPQQKKRRKNEEEELLIQVAKKITNEDEFSSFSDYVASRLRSLPPDQGVYVRKIINDAIFYGELGALNMTSTIKTENLMLHISQNDSE